MTVVNIPEYRRANPPAPRAGSARSAMVALFVSSAALYFAVGCLLVMRYNLFDPDAPSRVANAGYVLHSRDPHLSAVGFVWNPLPSLVEIPILQLSHWWPELRTHGLAGVLQSALFMAAAVLMVYRIALDRGVGVGWRRVSVATFALQPMIVVYGGSGMSEAAATFALLWCVRHLMRWTDDRRPADLALAGLALGIGYLARYEVVSAAVGVAAFVVLITVFGAAGARTVNALANVAIVMFPIVVVAAVWALSGWVVNQQLFATLSSQYGNESIVESAIRRNGSTVADGSREWVVAAARVFGMQPFAGIACAGAVIHGAITGRATALAPVITFGPVLAFAAWGQLTSSTFGAFRYYLLGIPLVICVALAMWPPTAGSSCRPSGGVAARRFGAALVSASILIGYPVTVIASLNERIGNQPLQFGFASLLFPDRFTPEQPHHVWYRRLMGDDRVLADHLDRMRLADGSVLTDTSNTWGVWTNSARPKQFLITSDYDFKAALNRPWEHRVQYLLVSNPESSSNADALNVRYPTLWNDGAEMSSLVYAISGVNGEERFRLYRVTGPPRPAGSR